MEEKSIMIKTGIEPAIPFIRMTRLFIMIKIVTEPAKPFGIMISAQFMTKTMIEPDILKGKMAKKLFMIKAGSAKAIRNKDDLNILFMNCFESFMERSSLSFYYQLFNMKCKVA